MTFPRHYPQTYGSGTWVKLIKIFEPLIIDSTSVTARGIKKTLVNIYGMFLRTYALSYPASYPRMRDAYYDIVKQVPTSTVDREISKQTTTIINLIASKPLSVFRDVSASSSVVGWVDQYIFTWAKLVERSVVSSVLQIQRGISKSVNPLIDGTVSVWRWVGKSMNTLITHIGTTAKTFITGFVKKMFTYPADPEFKVEEDE